MVLARWDHARRLHERGESEAALHVVDLPALSNPNDEPISAARALKAEICRALAAQTRVFVSQSLHFASAPLLDRGMTLWSSAPSPDVKQN
ncbi:hypothetical protein ACFYT4_34395 [Streptomyces sp. NPDC004609]|uniref:hypothetical protein n=1 Tax=Streptomyces sp. NPDC004609 TaxID=3364704 RepID=UPI0036BDAE76